MNFHPVRYTQTILQTSLTLDAGKKEIETFRQSTQAVEMKGQAPVIKSPWAIDFFLASVTSTVRRDEYTRFMYRVNKYRQGGVTNLFAEY